MTIEQVFGCHQVTDNASLHNIFHRDESKIARVDPLLLLSRATELPVKAALQVF